MAKDIGLKIYTPEKLALDKEIYRVVLPQGRSNLTIIKNRAPTSLILDTGVLQILNEGNEPVEKYFIDTGVADVAENKCTISTLHFIKTDKITSSEAEELAVSEPQSAEFYQMIVQYFKTTEK